MHPGAQWGVAYELDGDAAEVEATIKVCAVAWVACAPPHARRCTPGRQRHMRRDTAPQTIPPAPLPQYLEWREKQYDVRARVDVLGADGRPAARGALCYVASDRPANVNWLGEALLEDIAAQVCAVDPPLEGGAGAGGQAGGCCACVARRGASAARGS